MRAGVTISFIMAACGSGSGSDLPQDSAVDSAIGNPAIDCAPVGQIPPSAIHVGFYWIRSQADADAIAGVCEIDGSVDVEPGSMTALSLPNLEAITGGLYVSDLGGQLTAIDLPRLQTASGISVIATALSTLRLPQLTRTQGLDIERASLDRLELGPIESLDDYLAIVGVSRLANLDSLEHLTSAGSIFIVSNPQLTKLGLDALTTLSGTDSIIATNPLLPTCEAVELQRRVMRPIGIVDNGGAPTCMPAVGP